MKKRMQAVPLLVSLAFPAVSSAGEPLELSLRYSHIVALGYGYAGGIQASAAAAPRGGWGGVLDVGVSPVGKFVAVGPRVTGRRQGSVTPFAQLVAGAFVGEDTSVFLAHPSVGVDVGSGRATLRLQADWPLLVGSELVPGLVRVSAGIAFR